LRKRPQAIGIQRKQNSISANGAVYRELPSQPSGVDGEKEMDLLETALKLRELADALAEAVYGNLPQDSIDLPRLHCWTLGTHDAPNLVGYVEEHPVLGSRAISTSQLFFISEELGLARTLSRWYRLGERLQPDQHVARH
jgi:hypothetical protein